MSISEKWRKRFIVQAFQVSTWSNDPSTSVGAVISKGNRFVSCGVNGYPQGVEDKIEDRPLKYAKSLHAEENAILFAKRDLIGHSLFATHHPCSHCAAAIIQSDIKNVYIPQQEPDFMERWGESAKISAAMFKEAGVDVIQVDVDVDLIKHNCDIVSQSIKSSD